MSPTGGQTSPVNYLLNFNKGGKKNYFLFFLLIVHSIHR